MSKLLGGILVTIGLVFVTVVISFVIMIVVPFPWGLLFGVISFFTIYPVGFYYLFWSPKKKREEGQDSGK